MPSLDEGRSAPARSIWPFVARLVVAIVVVLAASELLVRLVLNGPSPQKYDPTFGYSYRANVEQFSAREGYARIRLNELGLNDRPVGPKQGRWRVLVVGDSYTASIQVPAEDNFTSVAERLDDRLDVVNAGRDGLFLGNLRDYARRFEGPVEADMIVYVISEGDVDDDIRQSDFRVSFNPANGEIRDAQMRVQGQELLKRRVETLTQHSALATRLIGQFKSPVKQALRTIRSFGVSQRPAVAAPVREDIVRPSEDDVLRFVFRQLKADVPVAIVYLNALKYQPDGRSQVEPSSRSAEERARDAAAAAGIPFIATAEPLQQVYAENGMPPFGFDNGSRLGGHLNELGHRAVGAVLRDLAVASLERKGASASR